MYIRVKKKNKQNDLSLNAIIADYTIPYVLRVNCNCLVEKVVGKPGWEGFKTSNSNAGEELPLQNKVLLEAESKYKSRLICWQQKDKEKTKCEMQ